jgi:hypothetical protein
MEEVLPCTMGIEEPRQHEPPPSQTQMKIRGKQVKMTESERASRSGVNFLFYFGLKISGVLEVARSYLSRWCPKDFAENGHKASAHAGRPLKHLTHPVD